MSEVLPICHSTLVIYTRFVKNKYSWPRIRDTFPPKFLILIQCLLDIPVLSLQRVVIHWGYIQNRQFANLRNRRNGLYVEGVVVKFFDRTPVFLRLPYGLGSVYQGQKGRVCAQGRGRHLSHPVTGPVSPVSTMTSGEIQNRRVDILPHRHPPYFLTEDSKESRDKTTLKLFRPLIKIWTYFDRTKQTSPFELSWRREDPTPYPSSFSSSSRSSSSGSYHHLSVAVPETPSISVPWDHDRPGSGAVERPPVTSVFGRR